MALTTVSPDGTKQATNVYAGGALIAKQKRHVAGGVNYDSIEWRTADPVTGTVARFDHASGGLTMTVENYEPLGQRLYPNDPEDYEPPTGSFGLNNADYPEWMCEEATAAFIWGDFAARPWACQRKYVGGEDRYGRYSTTYRIESPQKVGRVFYPAGHAPAGSDTGLAYAARQLRQDTITATAKDDSPGTCDWDKDGRPNCNVSVNPSSIDLADTGWTEPDEPPAYQVERERTESNTPRVSDVCKKALAAVGKDEKSLARAVANANWFQFSGQNFDPQILAAIAIRESGVDPNASESGGFGRGLMQIDVGQHPQYANHPDLFKPEWSVRTVDSLIAAEIPNLRAYGYEANGTRTMMLLRIYNGGYFKTTKRIGKRNVKVVDQAKMRALRNSRKSTDFDAGTKNGNYVTSILNIANHCFPSNWNELSDRR